MGMKSGGSDDLMGEINVTPMVDVMLVLLIIFMVAAPMMNTGVDIELPQVNAVKIEDPKGKLIPKSRTSFRWVPNGIPGVETRLTILFSEGVGKGRISLNEFVELTATNHARTYGLYPKKGTIAVGADAVMLGTALARTEEAPGQGWHWGAEAHHGQLPRGLRTRVGTVGPLEEVLFGPSRHVDGTSNLVGALRRSMATTGYLELKEFQRAEVVIRG